MLKRLLTTQSWASNPYPTFTIKSQVFIHNKNQIPGRVIFWGFFSVIFWQIEKYFVILHTETTKLNCYLL